MNDFRTRQLSRLGTTQTEHDFTFRTGWAQVITDGAVTSPVAIISDPEPIVFAKILGELVPTADTADAFDRVIGSDRDLYSFFNERLLDLTLGTDPEDQETPLAEAPLVLRLPEWFQR